MADTRDILIRLLGEETVSKMADRAGGGLDKFGKSLDATERDAEDLDRQIADVEGSLKTLAVAFARTSDAADRMDITKAIRRQQTELRRLTKSKDLLPDFGKAGVDAAEGFGASFVTRIGPLLAKAPMGATGGIIGAGIAAVVVPMLGAAVAGAVLGGVGVGGVVGGVALAAKDSRVQAAGKLLGETIVGDLEDSAARFVGPTIAGIGIIRGAWSDVADDVDGAFAATSRYVEPLARGLGGLVREIGPGLREAAEAAGPVVRELSEGLPRIGNAISDALADISGGADEGASAVRGLLMGLESGIRTTGMFVGGLAEIYGAFVMAGQGGAHFAEGIAGWLPVIGPKITDNREKMDQLAGALKGGGKAGAEAGDGIFGGLMKAGRAAADATYDVETFEEAVLRLTSGALSAEESNLRLEEALDRAGEAAKEGADKGIDPATKAGQKNREALLGLGRAAQAASADILANTHSHEMASVATEKARAGFLKAAEGMGVEKGEAIALANKIFGIPPEANTKADFQPDNKGVSDWKKTLSGIPRNVFIKAEFDLITNGDVAMALRLGRLSKGGPVKGNGPKGVDSQPYLLAPGEYVLPANEVDAAGGPAGVERLRSALRGESGGAVPAVAGAASGSGGGGGGAQRVEVVLRIEGDDRGIIGALLKGIRDMGGNPAVLGVGGNW